MEIFMDEPERGRRTRLIAGGCFGASVVIVLFSWLSVLSKSDSFMYVHDDEDRLAYRLASFALDQTAVAAMAVGVLAVAWVLVSATRKVSPFDNAHLTWGVTSVGLVVAILSIGWLLDRTHRDEFMSDYDRLGGVVAGVAIGDMETALFFEKLEYDVAERVDRKTFTRLTYSDDSVRDTCRALVARAMEMPEHSIKRAVPEGRSGFTKCEIDARVGDVQLTMSASGGQMTQIKVTAR
jgi:hypothetical protein